MMWIGFVAHEPRKFSSQMFCYQICVASMELDSTPSTNTRMGPWRNATPNKSRQTSYYASLSQLSITESGSHQTNVLIATAMIWICHPGPPPKIETVAEYILKIWYFDWMNADTKHHCCRVGLGLKKGFHPMPMLAESSRSLNGELPHFRSQIIFQTVRKKTLQLCTKWKNTCLLLSYLQCQQHYTTTCWKKNVFSCPLP